MASLTSIKKQLKHQISRGKLQVVQRDLETLLDQEQEIYDIYLKIIGGYHQLTKMNSQRSDDYYDQGMAKLKSRLIDFVNALRESDLSRAILLQYEIRENILVVAKSETRAQLISRYLPVAYFPSVEYDTSGVRCSVEYIEIVIYDDAPSTPRDERDELLEYYLRDTDIVVLFLGRYSPLLEQYPDKSYASNFVFSLHARLKEMADFLFYRRAYEAQESN